MSQHSQKLAPVFDYKTCNQKLTGLGEITFWEILTEILLLIVVYDAVTLCCSARQLQGPCFGVIRNETKA